MASSSSNIQLQSQSLDTGTWPPEHAPPVGYLSRKALPIKRGDAEPLTRLDVQYDLLNYIFTDKKAVFTPSVQGKSNKVTFHDLYVNALYNSSKCSKVLKDKMVSTPAFAIELAKISLLTNVGRINTTMAFFPEMKTALRTYHPVPSLQKTDGNAQDAPRIKNCLKAALLPSEQKNTPPSSPEEILLKSREGKRPPTSVVNLIFVLATHAAPLAAVHFDGVLNFLDLFLPKPMSSADRARVFLWHMYHYLEPSGTPNPFDDEYSRQYPPKAPLIRQLTDREMSEENIDTREEIEWGRKMSAERNTFLQKLVMSAEPEKKNKAAHFVPDVGSTRARFQRRGPDSGGEENPFMYYVPGTNNNPPSDRPSAEPSTQAEPSRPHTSLGIPRGSNERERQSMLQQAFHSIMRSDPLQDSDEEFPDEHKWLDYRRRLEVLGRIRGAPPSRRSAEMPRYLAALLDREQSILPDT